MKSYVFAVLVLGIGCSTVSTPSSGGSGAETPGAPPESDEQTQLGDAGPRDPAAQSDAGNSPGKPPARMGQHYYITNEAPFVTPGNRCATSGYWGDHCGSCKVGVTAPGVAALWSGHVEDDETPAIQTSCTETPSSSKSHVTYCCETPFIEIEGKVTAPKSCDDVCAADGLVCTEKAPIYDGNGIGPEPGSTHLRWRGPTYAMRSVIAACSYVPETTKKDSGKTFTLQAQTCECVDPKSTIPEPPQ